MSILTQRLPYHLEFLEFRLPAMVLIRRSVGVVLVHGVGVLLVAILRNIFLSSGLMRSYRIRFLLGDGEGLACGILTSHASNTPAISRSFIDKMCSSKRRITSGGKSMDQNIYLTVPFGPGIIHTPPAPYLHASE